MGVPDNDYLGGGSAHVTPQVPVLVEEEGITARIGKGCGGHIEYSPAYVKSDCDLPRIPITLPKLNFVNQADVSSNGRGLPPMSAAEAVFDEFCAPLYLDLKEIKREIEEIRKELLDLRRRREEARLRREMMFEREMMLHMTDDIERSIRFPNLGYPAMTGHFDVPTSDLHQPQDNCASDIDVPSPVPILFGANKRKAEWKSATLIGTDSAMAHLAKKPKGRWVCDLCQVSATSEKGLNDHLQGKKHWLMEAQIRGEEIETGFTNDEESEDYLAKEKETVIHYVHKAGRGPSGETYFKKTTRKTIVKRSVPSHGTKATVTGHAMNAAYRKKKGYKYWCGMCRIGSDSPVVYAIHEKGKKHLARLLELGRSNKTD